MGWMGWDGWDGMDGMGWDDRMDGMGWDGWWDGWDGMRQGDDGGSPVPHGESIYQSNPLMFSIPIAIS